MALREATPIMVSAQERATLEGWVRSGTTEHRLVERARIVLLAADGWASRAIAREVGCARGVVSRWRMRFAEGRLAGLADAPRSGKPRTYDEATDRRILALLDRPPPAGFARWTAPLLATALGDVSDQYIWRFLRTQRIDLAGRKSWCLSSDPEFAAQAAAIVGLYLAPPENAIVLAVDEKPAIQALERAQGYLKLPGGRSLHGQAHEYKRHGNSTLFTALNVATGQIKAVHTGRRRRIEFLGFMNQVVADYPDQEIHVVLDNLKTHKPKRDAWRARHRNVHSTSPRPTPAGSTRSRSGSRSSPAAPSTAPASPRSGSCAKPSMPSSKRTTRPPHPSNGNRPGSTPKASPNGSRIYDRKY